MLIPFHRKTRDSALFSEGKWGAVPVFSGLIIDDADMFIAACALVHGLTMVTNNTKHFRRIKGLKLDNWM